ncbi:MAG: sel1 repeat family protein [Alphaproteobacteria bacterium]|nr:sel1 repeat family protein [Alphaproteobacteria bacterium]
MRSFKLKIGTTLLTALLNVCNANAMTNVASEIGSADVRQKMTKVKELADQGNPVAQHCYAKYLLNSGDNNGAFGYFKLSADQKYTKAQYCCGLCLLNGNGVNRNLSEAINYIKLAADQGHAKSQLLYAILLRDEFLTKSNIKTAAEAIRYAKSAADQSYAAAQCCLGVWFYTGILCSHDISTAKHYLELAAKQNHAGAKNLLEFIKFKM